MFFLICRELQQWPSLCHPMQSLIFPDLSLTYTAHPPLILFPPNPLTPLLFISLILHSLSLLLVSSQPSGLLHLPWLFHFPMTGTGAGIKWPASLLSPGLTARAVKGSFVPQALHRLWRYVLCLLYRRGLEFLGPMGNCEQGLNSPSDISSYRAWCVIGMETLWQL